MEGTVVVAAQVEPLHAARDVRGFVHRLCDLVVRRDNPDRARADQQEKGRERRRTWAGLLHRTALRNRKRWRRYSSVWRRPALLCPRSRSRIWYPHSRTVSTLPRAVISINVL